MLAITNLMYTICLFVQCLHLFITFIKINKKGWVFPEGKIHLLELDLWETVFWKTVLLGNLPSRKFPSGKLNFWETVLLGNSRSWKLSTGQLPSWINPLENFLSSKIYAKKKRLMVKLWSVMALNTISNFTIDHLFFLPFTVYCNFTFIISSVFVVKSCDFRDSKR